MRYSLLSRFRGTLLGAALGETYGHQPQKMLHLSTSWSRMTILSAESLIQLGRFDIKDWQDCVYSKPTPEESSLLVSEGMILAALPVILFSHEYKGKLRQNLQQIVTLWQDDPDLRDGVLAVGYAIAQALREKLNSAVLIDKIIAFVQESQTPLVEQLKQVQTFLAQGVGLEAAVIQLSRNKTPKTTPIALAFYCFLSTLEDFRLSVTRAIRTGYQPQITGAITGALSGAYNSTAGIPTGWMVAFNQSNNDPTRDIQSLADRLLAVWSGVYQTSSAMPIGQLNAVAAPRVIQPR